MCIAAGRAAGGSAPPSPDVAPDQYGATAHRVGPRVMATAHVLHYGVGIPVRKVPAVLQMLTGVKLTESALVQDAQQRLAQGVGQEYRDLRRQIATAAVRRTPTTPGGGSAACPPS